MAVRLRVPSLIRRLARGSRAEGAYTLVELLVSMSILGFVLAGLSGIFVSSTNAEVDLRTRFEAQQEARLALDRLRRDIHCAATASSSASNGVLLNLPSGCPTGGGSVSWCAVASGTLRFALYRKAATSCDAGGLRVADYLRTSSIFTVIPQGVQELAKLRVFLEVDIDPSAASAGRGVYRLSDDIVLRNSTRS